MTREAVLEIAQRKGILATKIGLRPYDLYNADEVFFITSGCGIIPVVEISGRKIRDGKPGPLTQMLNKFYWEMRESREYDTAFYH